MCSSDLDRLRPVFELLLGTVLIVKDLPTARRLLGSSHGISLFVTPGGETVQPSGALSGGARRNNGNLLAQEREAIADEIGLPLIWDDAGDHSCVIASVWSGLDLDDHQRWTDYQGWFCDCLERFYEVFFERHHSSGFKRQIITVNRVHFAVV